LERHSGGYEVQVEWKVIAMDERLSEELGEGIRN
jgi:hypothetical protein